jgi:hypothetical protein
MATRAGAQRPGGACNSPTYNSVSGRVVVGTMDKFIYRGILILCCVILAIVLIVTPVMFKMYIDMKKTEVRIERKMAQLNRFLQKE